MNSRVSDFVTKPPLLCKPCGARERMIGADHSILLANAYRKPRTPAELKRVRSIMHSAKQRCENTNNIGYANYGGRGITFMFDSASHAAEWVLHNLGPCPSGCSIDRIDNDGNYEAGNLRWASRVEQANNKRSRARNAVGERVRRLQNLGANYTYESLRVFCLQGYSDDEIISFNKGKHRC